MSYASAISCFEGTGSACVYRFVARRTPRVS
jgi:hypothetical protein